MTDVASQPKLTWRVSWGGWIYLSLTIPTGTTLVFHQHDSTVTPVALLACFAFNLITVGVVVAFLAPRPVNLLEKVGWLRFMPPRAFGAVAPIASIFVTYFTIGAFSNQPIDSYSTYLLGVLGLFGAFAGFILTMEECIPRNPDHLKRLYEEGLKLLGPSVSIFLTVFVSSAYISRTTNLASRIARPDSLLATVFAAVIGIFSLLVIPLVNLSHIRRQMFESP